MDDCVYVRVERDRKSVNARINEVCVPACVCTHACEWMKWMSMSVCMNDFCVLT